MNEKTWKERLTEINTSGLSLSLKAAETALQTSVNMKGEIIHPGAFIVFARLIDEINDSISDVAVLCRMVDEESLKNDKAESEDAK